MWLDFRWGSDVLRGIGAGQATRTAEGVGLGSTEAEIKAAYGDGAVPYEFLSQVGQRTAWFVFSAEGRLRFELDEEGHVVQIDASSGVSPESFLWLGGEC